MNAPKKLKRFTAWEGPSELDGKPIALLVLRSKDNTKTGEIVQTYILRSDVSPIEARQSGGDSSICGSCQHSSKANGGKGTCYVRVDTGPNMAWGAYKRGKYPLVTTYKAQEELAGEKVRLGTYGDPAAIPQAVWNRILGDTVGTVGYTHEWREARALYLRNYCMASCDSPEDFKEARASGWRAFYVTPLGLPVDTSQAFLCPASEQGGRKLTCTDCMACDGLRTGRTASVYIPVHGVAFKVKRFTANLITIGKGGN